MTDRDRVINAMCLTWRHDFGLLGEVEREGLRRQMAQLYDHHAKPEVERARVGILDPERVTDWWKDEGRRERGVWGLFKAHRRGR